MTYSGGMSREGRVEHIHIAPDTGEDMIAKEEIEAVDYRGLRGDRYFKEKGIWNEWEDQEHTEASNVTFIEAEAIEEVRGEYGISLEDGEHRRNITTRDVALNHLVGEQFRVGDALVEGVGLCSPCGYMQGLVNKGKVAEALKHRGGLDANILKAGLIKRGDIIKW